MKGKYYAIQVTDEDGDTMLCWQKNKHLYFATSGKGFMQPPPPALFNKRKEAKAAVDGVPEKGGNLKQFVRVVAAKKIKIVPVSILLTP